MDVDPPIDFGCGILFHRWQQSDAQLTTVLNRLLVSIEEISDSVSDLPSMDPDVMALKSSIEPKLRAIREQLKIALGGLVRPGEMSGKPILNTSDLEFLRGLRISDPPK
jgi:hypothetical protein